MCSFSHNSTLIALHAPWIHSKHTDPSSAQRCHTARMVVQQITDRISANLVERKCFVGRDLESISPWGLFFAYHICSALMYSRRDLSEQEQEVVKTLKESFTAINARWNIAGTD